MKEDEKRKKVPIGKDGSQDLIVPSNKAKAA